MAYRTKQMPLEIADGTDLRRCVERWVDADLLLVGDGEALLDAASDRPGAPTQLEYLRWVIEGLVAEGALSAAEAAPALCVIGRALEG
jgi:hypothetical protein